MKKILAIVLSLVMAFSLALPASAATIDGVQSSVGNIADDASAAGEAAKGVYDSIVAEDYEAALDGAFDFAAKLAKAIHTLVCTLADMFDFNCPFCDDDVADNDAAAEEEPSVEEEVVYETAGTVVGEVFEGADLAFTDAPYVMNVDAAYVFSVPTNSIAIDGIATANVKTVIVLEEGATTGKITFTSENVTNYFHNVEGFKLIVNNSGVAVPVILNGDLSFTDGTVINAANIGDYIDGPYTLTVL